MSQSQSGSTKNVLQLILSITLLAVAGWIFLNRQYVLDQIAISNFKPSSEIAALAADTSMTDQARRYFYASKPEIQEAAEFNDSCPTHGEESIILGCYSGGRIYVFNVVDERLDGIKEVTAAHEMLHAAYDRLNSKEKSYIDSLLEAEAGRITDERIKKLIELYRKSEPEQLMNEAHSIFATEVATLSPELEAYYQQYFSDRQKVIAYSRAYESVFSGIKLRQQAIIAELERLSGVIEQRSNELRIRNDQLARDIVAYNKRAATPGGFSSQAAADRDREALLERRSNLQQERNEILELIDQAKQLEDEHEALLGELESLNRIIDSTPDEVPSI